MSFGIFPNDILTLMNFFFLIFYCSWHIIEWELFSVCFEKRPQRFGLLLFFKIKKNICPLHFLSLTNNQDHQYSELDKCHLFQSTQSFFTMGSCNSLETLCLWVGYLGRQPLILSESGVVTPLESWVVQTGLAGFHTCTACNLTLSFKWFNSFCATRWEAQIETFEGLGGKKQLPNEILHFVCTIASLTSVTGATFQRVLRLGHQDKKI